MDLVVILWLQVDHDDHVWRPGCLSPPHDQPPSKGDLRRTLLLRSPLDPLEGRRAAVGPDGDPEGPWGRRGVPRGSEHQSCTNTGQSSDPSDDYMLRAALEGTHFFLGENRHANKKIPMLLFYCNSPNGYAHSNCTAILCKGVSSIRKVTVPLSKPIALGQNRGSTLAFNIGIQHWHSTLTFDIDIQHWHSTLAFNIGIQHWHSTLTLNIDIRHWHSTLAFSIDIEH